MSSVQTDTQTALLFDGERDDSAAPPPPDRLHILKEAPTYTHNFFPYPAKFPSEPVRQFLQSYSVPGDKILDPFCGSGTVLVEAVLHGRDACGLELDPVAALVARAKSTLYREDVLTDLQVVIHELSSLQTNISSWIEQTVTEADVPAYKNVNHWFQQGVLYELAALRKAFCRNDQWSVNTKQLLWMGFLKIIVQVSNQDTETRYASVEKPTVNPGFVTARFRQTLCDYARSIEQAQPFLTDLDATATVYEGDSIENLHRLPCEQFDLAITSPPYINTFDYYLYHKHRIFWMDRDPREIRRKEVGCHHRVDRMNYEVATAEYRSYLSGVLSGVRARLKPGAHFGVLIGDGIVKDQMVFADQLMRELAIETSFDVVSIVSINLGEVTKRFIRVESLKRKQHHVVVLRRPRGE